MTTGMNETQALMFLGRRRLEWRGIPAPALRADTDVLVRPFVATRCDGDKVFLLHAYDRWLSPGAKLGVLDGRLGSGATNPFQAPFAYGHEGVAEVIACGSAVTQLKKGDRVIVPWALSCGACADCTRGATTACGLGTQLTQAFGFGKAFGDNGGMLSDCLRIPHADHLLVKVPLHVDPVVVASASDNVSDAYRAVAEPLRERPGAPVLIVGGAASSIGLYAAGIAVALGGSPVHYLDVDRTRLEVAERLGALPIAMARNARWFTQGEPRHPGGYAVSVEASAHLDGLHYAIRALGREGLCTAIGFYVRRGTPLPLWDMYMKGVTFKSGLAHARTSLPAVLDLIASGRFDPSRVTSVVADWKDAPRVFTEPHLKPVVVRPMLAAGG